MTTFNKDFIEINLSTDELMLKELERRDGIYSFIFHELEGPKSETPTISISPGKIIDKTYAEAIEKTKTKSTTKGDEVNGTESNSANEDNDNNCCNNNLHDKVKIKVETFALNQRSNVICHSNNTTTPTATTKPKSMTHSAPSNPTSLINALSTDKSASIATAICTISNATPAIVATSLFATATTTTLATSTATNAILPLSCLPSLSSLNMRNYHEHFKTWHPPPTFVYDNPKLYAYMANCGFRVRLPTPRFSHITAPLVRNRRHALKETTHYQRMSELGMCAPVADLRTLFPLDPDVHAPFATSLPGVELTMTGLTDVGAAQELEEIVELVEADCCGNGGGMAMVSGVGRCLSE